MKKSFVTAFFSVCLALTFGIQSQAQDRDRSAPPQPNAQAAKITLTGCLAKGTDANQYTITEQDTHKMTSFPAPAQLDRFVGQVVKLTGTMSEGKNGDKVFMPDSVASVASSCA